MPSEFVQSRRVEFADTDMAGIAHFSNFFRWMEETEHAFVRSLGHDVHGVSADGMHGFARLRASCDYAAPLHYPEDFEVHLAVRARSRSTVTYAFRFVRGGEDVATGELVVCCIGKGRDDEALSARPIPDDLAAALEVVAETD